MIEMIKKSKNKNNNIMYRKQIATLKKEEF